ncbi:MAG: CarD family transcriptional regulator [Anaerovoracaceae bacterium]
MYDIGDKIVYPMHGAGVIEKIEEKKILGEVRKYYILNVPYGDMRIMIPVENSDDIGVRTIMTSEELDDIVVVLKDVSSTMPNNWNRRYRENMEKLKTGSATEVAQVVRNLMRTDREKKLSTGEKKMLTNAKQILLSEIILVGGMDSVAATTLIEEAV